MRYQRLRLIIEGGSRLIQQDHVGLAHHSTGDGQALALATGEVRATFLKDGKELIRLLLDEVPNLGVFQTAGRSTLFVL